MDNKKEMKLSNFTLAALFLCQIGSSYILKKTIDPSTLTEHGKESLAYGNKGLTAKADDEIPNSFIQHNFVDHLLFLAKNKKKLLVRDDIQCNIFMDDLDTKIDELMKERVDLYEKTKKIQEDIEAKKKRIFFKIGMKKNVNDLEAVYNKNLVELEELDKKILKLTVFEEYCLKYGCLEKPKETTEDPIEFVVENAAKTLDDAAKIAEKAAEEVKKVGEKAMNFFNKKVLGRH